MIALVDPGVLPVSSRSPELVAALVRGVDAAAPGLPRRLRAAVVMRCLEAVEFAHEEPAGVAVRARSATHLLLELGCPQLTPAQLDTLSAVSAGVAVRLLPR